MFGIENVTVDGVLIVSALVTIVFGIVHARVRHYVLYNRDGDGADEESSYRARLAQLESMRLQGLQGPLTSVRALFAYRGAAAKARSDTRRRERTLEKHHQISVATEDFDAERVTAIGAVLRRLQRIQDRNSANIENQISESRTRAEAASTDLTMCLSALKALLLRSEKRREESRQLAFLIHEVAIETRVKERGR